MGFAAYYLSFLLIKPDHLKHHQCPPTQRYMNMLSDHPDASTKYTHKQTKWINMMCFKRGLMPNPYEISHPSTHKFHHLAATSTFRSVLSHLGIKAPDEIRSIYRTMAAVDSGCEPLNVKVFQAWLLAVTHHVDVQVYWIEHTELEGLDPGELKRTDMCIYIYKHLAISKVLRQFIPTSHHVRDLYVSHHVTLIPLYVILVQQVIAFVFESVLESLRLKSRFSTLQQLLASWSQTWKWAVSVDWYAMDFNAPNITTAAWDKKLPNSSRSSYDVRWSGHLSCPSTRTWSELRCSLNLLVAVTSNICSKGCCRSHGKAPRNLQTILFQAHCDRRTYGSQKACSVSHFPTWYPKNIIR